MRYREIIENDEEHAEELAKTGFWGKEAAGCIFMSMSSGRILLAHRSSAVLQPNTWGTWGGAMDHGESPLEAVKREAFEECGKNVTNDHIVPLYVFKSGNFRYYNFLVLVPHEFDPALNWETQGYDWCYFGDWPSPLHFGLRDLLSDPDSVAKIKSHIHTKNGRRFAEEDVDEDIWAGGDTGEPIL